jgi:hypothetical protein
MGNRKNLPQPGNPNPALSLNAKIFYRKKVAPPPAPRIKILVSEV